MPLAAVWTVVGLLALLVGVAVPALLQLRRTLAVTERTLESTGRKLDRVLDELTGTLDRVNRAAEGLERGAHRAASLLEALGEIGDAVAKIKSSLGVVAAVGASVGPVLVAAIRAAFGRDDAKPRHGGDAVEVER